jgi:RNA polymerase sigma factor (sigma-70 family)
MTMLTDAVLVDRVVAGFEGDFEELYRRHASAAWRVAQAVTGNAHDAADAVAEAFARVFQAVKSGRLTDAGAFRAYLMTATRNASLDQMRKSGKTRPTAEEDLDVLPANTTGPQAAIDGKGDAAMMAEAFRNLPERWRSVLWLTAVEGVATKDVATQLGISANGAAQLAVRARAGLRERYLQAHLKHTTDPECRFTVDRLGAYVGGGLAPRDIAKVDQHLAACESCRAKKEELDDVGSSLRRIALPLPIAVAGLAAASVHGALTGVVTPITEAPSVARRVMAAASNPTPRLQRALAGTAAGVFGLGMMAAVFSGGSRPTFTDLSAPAGAESIDYALELPSMSDLSFDRVAAYRYRTSSTASSSPRSTSPGGPVELPRSSAPSNDPSFPVPTKPTTKPTGGTPTGGAPADHADDGGTPLLPELPGLPEEPIIDATIGGSLGGNDVGVTVEVSNQPEIGIEVGDIVIGTDPETPDEDGLSVSLDPTGADPIDLTLP